MVLVNNAGACRLIKDSVAHWGTVDVLVNNAGITRDTLIMRMKPEQWQSVIDTNLSAVFYASQVICSCTSHALLGQSARGITALISTTSQHMYQGLKTVRTNLCCRLCLSSGLLLAGLLHANPSTLLWGQGTLQSPFLGMETSYCTLRQRGSHTSIVLG